MEVVIRLIALISILSGLESLREQLSQHAMLGARTAPRGGSSPFRIAPTAAMKESAVGAQPGR